MSSHPGDEHPPLRPAWHTLPAMDLEALLAGSSRTQGLVTADQLKRAGISPGSVTRLVADAALHRVRRGVYSGEPLPALPRFVVTAEGVSPVYALHVRAALLSLGDGAVAARRTAAALRGWPLLVEPGRTLEIDLPHGRGRAAGHQLSLRLRRNLPVEMVEVLPGTARLPLSTPELTVVAGCLERPLLEAVVLADSALRQGHVTVAGLLRQGARLQGVRDSWRVREALLLADSATGSVLETVQRVRMVQAGLTAFETQVVLRVWPELRVDFCFRHARLVVEVDGQKWHPDPRLDRTRDNALVARGWRVLRYTWAEVVHDWPRVLEELQAALVPGCEDIHLGSTQAAAAS
jgi:very-short-patch-repair endonuclease